MAAIMSGEDELTEPRIVQFTDADMLPTGGPFY